MGRMVQSLPQVSTPMSSLVSVCNRSIGKRRILLQEHGLVGPWKCGKRRLVGLAIMVFERNDWVLIGRSLQYLGQHLGGRRG